MDHQPEKRKNDDVSWGDIVYTIKVFIVAVFGLMCSAVFLCGILFFVAYLRCENCPM